MKMMSTKMCNVLLMIAAMVAMMKSAARFRADFRLADAQSTALEDKRHPTVTPHRMHRQSGAAT